MSSSVTRFPSGISTSESTHALASLPFPDPTLYHSWYDDFDNFEADQWVITSAGAATHAASSADGGVLLLTNAAADNDADFLQWSGDDASGVIETFKFVSGKKLWFKARFKVSDATQSDLVIGLQITDTTPLDVTDGVFFQKDDGDALLDFHVEKDNTATSSTSVATLANDTYVIVAFYYDGVSAVEAYVDNVKKATLATTNLPDDEELTISFGIQNGEAVAKTMSIDYIFVVKER